jgi:hypothetical protein
LPIAKEREKEIKAEILSGTLWQERLKKQLEECSRNRRRASATATSAEGGTSCQGHTASRRTADEDDANTDDWQAELLHNVNEDTFEKLDGIAADLDEMATRERWLFCRSCKAWHTVPCSKTSSKFLMLSILGLLLQTRLINAADMQGKGDYSIADSHGVAVYEHRYDAVLDASTSIIVIEMPFLRLRVKMGKLKTEMGKASKEYNQERELYAGLQEELKRFETMLSSTVDLFTVKDERKARTLAEWLGGLLGLYNTVKVKQIETKEDSTRDAFKTALVHLNAMDLHEKEEEKSIGEVIEKLEATRKLMFRGSRARQAKNSWHKVREQVQAFIKVGDRAGCDSIIEMHEAESFRIPESFKVIPMGSPHSPAAIHRQQLAQIHSKNEHSATSLPVCHPMYVASNQRLQDLRAGRALRGGEDLHSGSALGGEGLENPLYPDVGQEFATEEVPNAPGRAESKESGSYVNQPPGRP